MGKKDKKTFEADGFLKNTYLDKHGSKNVTFEFSAAQAVEVAKLELMGRDLIQHLPVLLKIKVEISPDNERLREGNKHPQQKRNIRRRSADS